MLIVILVASSLVLGLVTIFPYSLYPASLMLFRQRPIQPRVWRRPTATLVFCAYNEEASIPAKLDNLVAIRRICPTMRFHCFVDLSSDRTLELLRSRSDLVAIETAHARVGKASGMARIMSNVTTDIVIFTDANVLLDPKSVLSLLEYFRDPEIGGVCGTLHYTNADETDTTRTSTAYWRLEERIKSLESRSGSTIGADGSIFATRRALYPEVPPNLLDDFIVSMSVVFKGLRLISAPDVRAFETAATDRQGERRRRRRIACRAYRTHRFLWPGVQALPVGTIYKYIGHKLIRWYTIWSAILSGLLAIAAVLLAAGKVGAFVLVCLGLLAVAMRSSRPMRIAVETLVQFWATGMGMLDAWRGREYQTWEPPARSALSPLDAALVPERG
ncbi:glycosyltransferase [Sphingomonas oryzagri]